MADDITTEIPIAPLKNIDTDEQFYPITHVDAVEGLEGYGGTVTEINKLEGIIMTSTDGTVSLDSIETEGNIGIETTHIYNSVGKLGGIKPGKYFSEADAVWNDTNIIATHGITESSDTDITISSATSTAGRFYPLQVDKNGVGFVNVPWVEGEPGQVSDYTLRLATNSTIWLQKDLSDYSSITIPTFAGTSIGLVPFDDTIASADRGNYHLTAAGTWVLPIDSKVSQTLNSANTEYPILLSTVSTSGNSDGAYYSTTTINASTGAMTVTSGNNRTIFNSGSSSNPVTVQSRADALSNWSTISNQILTTSGLVPAPTSGYFLRYTTADGFNWANVSDSGNTTYYLTLNNTINGGGTVDLGTLFAPTTGTTTTTGATAANQLLLSNSAITAPTWTNFTFPTGSGNTRLLKYVVGTGWTLDSTTYLTDGTTYSDFGLYSKNFKHALNGASTDNTVGTVIRTTDADFTFPTFYAPITAGTQYSLLNSNGSGAPTWMTPSATGLLKFTSGTGWSMDSSSYLTNVSLSDVGLYNKNLKYKLNSTTASTLGSIARDTNSDLTLPEFYAPTRPGTKYDILTSNGSESEPTWVTPSGTGLLKYTSGTGWGIDTNTYLTTLPSATTSAIGGIKVGAVLGSASGASTTDTDATKRYSVLIDNNNLGYVNVPWSNTTYSDFTGATSSTAGTNGLVPAPAAGDQLKFLSGGANWLSFDTTNIGGAKSVINLKDGNTTLSTINVRMAASPIPSGITTSNVSQETTFSEVLFYPGNGISFNKVVSSASREGLKVSLQNATDTNIGGIKVSSTPANDAGTVYSGTGTYYPIQVAPDANQSACIACVKVPNTTPYSLPVATQSTLGGLIVLADKDAATGYQNNKDIIAIPIFKGAIESKTTIIDGGEEITSNVEECHYVNVYDVLYTIEKDKDLRDEFKRVLDIS